MKRGKFFKIFWGCTQPWWLWLTSFYYFKHLINHSIILNSNTGANCFTEFIQNFELSLDYYFRLSTIFSTILKGCYYNSSFCSLRYSSRKTQILICSKTIFLLLFIYLDKLFGCQYWQWFKSTKKHWSTKRGKS